MRRFAVLLSLVVATPAAAQDGEAAVRAFLAAPAGPAINAAQAADVTTAGGTVTLRDLALTFALPDATDPDGDTLTLTAPVAEIDNLARTATGWRADAIRLPEATLTPSSGALADGRVGRVELTAPAWPAPVAAPATAGPAGALEPIFTFVRGISADSIRLDGDGLDLAVGTVEAGKVATATLTVTFPAAANRDDLEVDLSGLDAGAVADALLADGGPSAVALAGLTMTGFDKVEPGADRGSLGTMRLEGLTLTPQSPPLAARIDDYDAVMKAAESAPPEPLPADPDLAPTSPPTPEAIDLAVAVWQAIGLDLMAFEDFEAERSETGDTTRIGRIAFAEVGAGRAADVTVDDIAVDMPAGDRVSIERLELLDLKMPDERFIRQMALADGAPPSVETIVGTLPVLRRIAMTGLVANTQNGIVFSIGEAAGEMGGHIGTIPTMLSGTARGAIDLTNAVIPDDPSAATAIATLKEHGLARLTFTGREQLSWADDRLAYESQVEVPGLARYGLALTMSGFPRYVFEEPRRAVEIVAFLSLDAFKFEIADLGVVPLVRDVAAQQAGGDGADVDARLAAGLAEVDAALAPQLGPEVAATVRDALTRFVEGGRTITLAADPERPVPVTQLGAAAIAPRALIGLLGLTLTVTP